MFTGIVQGKATVLSIKEKNGLNSLSLEFPDNYLAKLQRGASIAINGTCLTVVTSNPGKNEVSFDVMNETLSKTNLVSLAVGDQVNFERAAKIGDEIGGHLMSGHIHTCVSVCRVVQSGDNCSIYFDTPRNYRCYLLEKGFVGLNGCSLTLGEVRSEEFCVHLIPETRMATTFGEIKKGDQVNLEVDHQTQSIVDTVERVLQQRNLVS